MAFISVTLWQSNRNYCNQYRDPHLTYTFINSPNSVQHYLISLCPKKATKSEQISQNKPIFLPATFQTGRFRAHRRTFFKLSALNAFYVADCRLTTRRKKKNVGNHTVQPKTKQTRCRSGEK